MSQVILDRLESEGPVDIFISEDEYVYLKGRLRTIWRSSSWSRRDCSLVLAFLRAYTFYRELAENDAAFWVNFHAELGFHREPVPTPTQYNNLWGAFTRDKRLEAYLCYDQRGRAFVATINEIWGFRSLRAGEVIPFFIRYYREHPGKRLTESLMRKILPWASEVALRQAASYDRVFLSMTHAVDFILEHDLEGMPLDELEEKLSVNNVELGDPNPLRFFTNKSGRALGEILAQLRLQRTPEQFRRFLATVPGHVFETPLGRLRPSHTLARSETLDYGRYIDRDTEEEHHVTPAARISLNIIDRLSVSRFENVAGLELFLSPDPFQVRVGNALEESKPIYLQRGLHYLWAGRAKRGIALEAGGTPHPAAVGWSAEAVTRLDWNDGKARLLGELRLDLFEPQLPHDLVLTVDKENYVLSPTTQGFLSTFQINGTVNASLEDRESWTWTQHEHLFSASGRELPKGVIRYGPKQLYLLADNPQAADGVSMQRIQGELPLWEVTWDGNRPLNILSWTIKEPFRSASYRANTYTRPRPRADVEVSLHSGFFEANERIELQFEEALPRGTVLELAGHNFLVRSELVTVSGLPPGRYAGRLISSGEVISELEPFLVLPHLTWLPARDNILSEGKTQAGRVAFPDGQLATFRWKPALNDDGSTRPVPCYVSVGDVAFGFDLRAMCCGLRVVDPGTGKRLRTLPSLNSLSLRFINPYQRDFDLRARLASDPMVTRAIEDISQLTSTDADTLSVELRPDGRTDAWVPLARLEIKAVPRLELFDIRGGICQVKVTGVKEVQLNIEEYDPRTGVMVEHTHRAPSQ